MYLVRIPIGIALLAGVAGILWLDDRVESGAVFAAALGGVGMRALYEVYRLAGLRSPALRTLGVVGAGALLVSPWVDRTFPGALGPLRAFELTGAMLVALIAATALAGDAPPAAGGRPNGHTLGELARCLAGLAYVAFPLSFLMAIKMDLPARLGLAGVLAQRGGVVLVLYLVFVAKGADMGGFLVGKPFGRHKILPRISPNKSWEGAIGGVAMSIAFAIALSGWLPRPLAPFRAVLFGAAMAPLSLAGDLLESYLKRWSGSKDSGQLIPSYGGVLDLIDSLILTAPLGYVLLLILL